MIINVFIKLCSPRVPSHTLSMGLFGQNRLHARQGKPLNEFRSLYEVGIHLHKLIHTAVNVVLGHDNEVKVVFDHAAKWSRDGSISRIQICHVKKANDFPSLLLNYGYYGLMSLIFFRSCFFIRCSIINWESANGVPSSSVTHGDLPFLLMKFLKSRKEISKTISHQFVLSFYWIKESLFTTFIFQFIHSQKCFDFNRKGWWIGRLLSSWKLMKNYNSASFCHFWVSPDFEIWREQFFQKVIPKIRNYFEMMQ